MERNYKLSGFLQFVKNNVNKLSLVSLILSGLSPEAIYSQQTYTFTNAGATGRLGPTQLQINTAYASTNLNGLVVSNSGIQNFTVNAGGLYRIEAWGASGGNTQYAGKGSRVIGDVNIPAGTVLQILVGQMGSSYATSNSDGGGGGSFVAMGPTLLFAAGGGGGGAQVDNGGKDAVLTETVVSGIAQQFGSAAAGYSVNGVHFTYGIYTTVGQAFTNGGNGQAGGQAGGWPGSNYGEGGFGGGGSSCACSTGGGGGGGGYVGGGGGATNPYYPSGFGGSSYKINSAVNGSVTALAAFGHGKVILTPLCNITINPSTNPICIGSSLTLSTNAVSGISWSNGSTNSSIVISPTATSVYSVTGTSSAACVATNIVTVTVQSPSINAVSSATSVCLNTTVSLTGSGANTYTWSGGITNGVPFTPSATANYTLTATGACGTYTTVRTITVAPLPVVGLATPTVVCAGNVASLAAGGATTYTWMPGNMVGANVVVSPQVTTVYTVTGSSGVCGGVSTLTLTANPNPTITTSASSSVICGGTTVTLTANGASSYTWQSGPTTGSVLVVTPTAPAAYPVSGTNSFGCTTNTSQVVIANPSPIITVLASNNQICLGGSSTLTASGGSNYLWNTGSTNAVEVVNPLVSTVYTVTSVNPSSNCVGTQTVSVSVFTQTLSVSNSTAICMGNSVTLNASGATTYSWSNGSTSSSIFVFPTSSTVYSVSATTATNNMNCESSGTISVTVNPNPTVTAVVTKTVICKGETTTITATGATTYSWNTTATTSVISISPTANTNYTVTGTNANGCVNTTTIQAKVSSCTGIETLNGKTQNAISIYPNPSNGEFSIKSDVAINLSLINELGQTVRLVNLSELNNYQVTVSDLASGIYFVVGNKDNLNVNQKIVVAK